VVVHHTRLRSWSERTPEEFIDNLSTTLESLTPDQYEILQVLLNDEKLYSLVTEIEYEREVVPVEEWLEDPYHMGEVVKNLYPQWREDLLELFTSSQYYVALITGGLGSGKSEFASIAILRMLYEASCLRDPCGSYGLNTGARIDFGIFAPSEMVARTATFEKIISKIRLSPYFMEVFPPLNKLTDNKIFKSNTINFPKNLNIICGSSTDSAALGANIMGAFVDELNFFKKRAKGSGGYTERWGDYDRAGKIFDGLSRRMKSRFLKIGKLPGVLIGASSKEIQDSLMERFIRQAARTKDPKVFVRDRNILEVKSDSFSRKKFRVLVGTEHYRSRILEDDEVINSPDADILQIPEDLRTDFEIDLESSLRDIAGVSTFAISNFISKVEKIQDVKDPSRKHPFVSPFSPEPLGWDSFSPYRISWDQLSKRYDDGTWEPLLNPHAMRYVHLDPASTGDAFGLAIVHIAGRVAVRKKDGDESSIVEYQPYFVVDFILRITGSQDEPISYRNVRRLLYDFVEHGFAIKTITMDTYQSLEMGQILADQGFKTKVLSVDESKEPYRYLRTAIYEDRLKCYDYPIFYQELTKLEDTARKVDHPANGSKDIADSVCGAIYMASQSFSNSESIISLGFSEEVVDEREEFEQSTLNAVSIDSNVKVYKKRPAETMKPSYNKVSTSGKVVDLLSGTAIDDDDYDDHILGSIEVG
jgi:hypothetical protein